MIRINLRRGTVAGIAAGTLLAATACGADEIGAAAVVGGDRITVTTVQDKAETFLDTTEDPSGVDTAALQRRIVQQDVRHELLTDVAADTGAATSEAAVDDFLEELSTAQGGDLTQFKLEQGFTDESLRSAVHDELLRRELVEELGSDEAVEEAVSAKADEVGVTVNRRYGTWEGNQIAEGTGAIASVLDQAVA